MRGRVICDNCQAKAPRRLLPRPRRVSFVGYLPASPSPPPATFFSPVFVSCSRGQTQLTPLLLRYGQLRERALATQVRHARTKRAEQATEQSPREEEGGAARQNSNRQPGAFLLSFWPANCYPPLFRFLAGACGRVDLGDGSAVAGGRAAGASAARADRLFRPRPLAPETQVVWAAAGERARGVPRRVGGLSRVPAVAFAGAARPLPSKPRILLGRCLWVACSSTFILRFCLSAPFPIGVA